MMAEPTTSHTIITKRGAIVRLNEAAKLALESGALCGKDYETLYRSTMAVKRHTDTRLALLQKNNE